MTLISSTHLSFLYYPLFHVNRNLLHIVNSDQVDIVDSNTPFVRSFCHLNAFSFLHEVHIDNYSTSCVQAYRPVGLHNFLVYITFIIINLHVSIIFCVYEHILPCPRFVIYLKHAWCVLSNNPTKHLPHPRVHMVDFITLTMDLG